MAMTTPDYQYKIDTTYNTKLEQSFPNVKFVRIEKTNGKYVTNDENKSFKNDFRILKETQIKRLLRSKFVLWFLRLIGFDDDHISKKLGYFYLGENKDESKIYKDKLQLSIDSEYSVQNLGHATVLIKVQDCSIIIDPVFSDLNSILYPAKTRSSAIDKLPKIDVILISHNHRDHVDKSSLEKIIKHYQKQNWSLPKVFVPMGDKKLFTNIGFTEVEEVEWFTKITLYNENAGKNEEKIDFISIPADHRSGRSGFDSHKSLVTGWVINPKQEVVFKYSGDTRPLTDENQKSIDAILYELISEKRQQNETNEMPDIICLEPSGPNYTRSDMKITHQSTSYSIFLILKSLSNFLKLNKYQIDSFEKLKTFFEKFKTFLIHHNKYELGPDRYDEGRFILKKAMHYISMSDSALEVEKNIQEEKLNSNKDISKLLMSEQKDQQTWFKRSIIARLLRWCIKKSLSSLLPKETSLATHAKDFIVDDVIEAKKVIQDIEKTLNIEITEENTTALLEIILDKAIFPLIDETINNQEIKKYEGIKAEDINKYHKLSEVTITRGITDSNQQRK